MSHAVLAPTRKRGDSVELLSLGPLACASGLVLGCGVLGRVRIKSDHATANSADTAVLSCPKRSQRKKSNRKPVGACARI